MFKALSAPVHALRANSFLANAIYLMLSTGALAVFGFLFWVVVTRSYDATAVGLATTLLSVSGLIALLSLAGFDAALVRFLPSAKNKNTYTSSAFIIVGLVSICLSALGAVILPLVSPSLGILGTPAVNLAFVFFTLITALNTVVMSVFLAHKKARYIFGLNILLGVAKLALPLCVTHGNAATIFILAGIAQVTTLVCGLVWLRRSFSFRFITRLDVGALGQVKKFSLSAYAASALNLLPPTLLPLLIIAYLGPAPAAYYYMAFTIASALYTIAYASMQSVFAEGSHNQAALGSYTKKAVRLVLLLLLPAAGVVAITSSLLLHIFGPDYAQQSSQLLQLFALGALPVAGYSALGAICKVTKNLVGMISMNLAYAAIILGLSAYLLPQMGVAAVGWAWLGGNTAACLVGVVSVISKKPATAQ